MTPANGKANSSLSAKTEGTPCVMHDNVLLTLEEAIEVIEIESVLMANSKVSDDVIEGIERIYGRAYGHKLSDEEISDIIDRRREYVIESRKKKRKTQSKKKTVQKDNNTINIEEYL